MSDFYGFISEEIVDFNQNDVDDESKWAKYGKKGRGIAAVTNFSSSNHFTTSSLADTPYEPAGIHKITNSKITNSPNICPEKPLLIGRHNFMIPKSKVEEMCGSSEQGKMSNENEQFMTCTRMINAFLEFLKPYDFSFISSKEYPPMWKGKYIQGSVSCLIDIHIYAGDEEGSYMVEARRVMGDAKPFHSFYREFKSLVTGIVPPEKPQQLQFKPLDAKKLSDVDFLRSVKPMFHMACSEFYESRLEASKMLCDFIAKHNEQVELPDFVTECVAHLEKLVFDSFTDVSHHAIIAIASVVDRPCYQNALVSSHALPFLFNMLEKVPEPMFDSIQVRRESASILATLSKVNPRGVAENLQLFPGEFKAWVKKAEELRCDAELYNLTCELRQNLVKVVV